MSGRRSFTVVSHAEMFRCDVEWFTTHFNPPIIQIMQKKSILGKYQMWLDSFMHSPETDRLLIYKALKFLEWGNNEKIQFPDTGNDFHTAYKIFMRYIIEHRKNVSERTAGNTVSCLKSFFRFMSEEYPAYRFYSVIQSCKFPKNLPRVFTVDEVDRLLAAIETNSIIGIRDYCLFELIYSSGLRNSEASNLLVKSLLSGCSMIIVKGKGGKERLVPYGTRAKKALDEYMKIRNLQQELRIAKCNNLFLSNNGGKLSIREILFRQSRSRELLRTHFEAQLCYPSASRRSRPCINLKTPWSF